MGKKNLLLFESDTNFANLLKGTFKEFDFNVFIAKTESNVQEYLGLDTIDLFILRAETTSSQANGFLLCKKIREINEYKNAPILILSSNSDEEVFERHKTFPFAADYYMHLPQDIETIMAAAHLLCPFADADSLPEIPSSGSDEIELTIDEEDVEVADEITIDDEELIVDGGNVTIDEDDIDLADEISIEEKTTMPESSGPESNNDEALNVDELQEIILALSAENESLNTKIQELEQSVVAAPSEDHEKMIALIQEEKEALQTKISELETTVDSTKEDIGELEEIKLKCSQLYKENAELKDRIESFESSESTVARDDEYERAAAELSKEKERNADLLKEVGELKETILQRTKQVDNLVEKLEEADKVDSNQAQLTVLKESVEEQQEKNNSLMEENERLKKLSEKRDSSSTTSEDERLVELEDENEDLRIINKQMKEKVRKSDKKNVEVMDDYNKMKSQHDELMDKINSLEEQNAQLVTEKEKLDNKASEFVNKIEEMTATQNEVIKEKNNLEKELKEQITAAEEMEAVAAELSTAVDIVELNEKEIAELDQSLKNSGVVQFELEEKIKEREDIIESLKDDIVATKEEYDKVTQARAELLEEVNSSGEELASLKEAIAAKDTEIETLQSQVEKINKTIAMIKELVSEQ